MRPQVFLREVSAQGLAQCTRMKAKVVAPRVKVLEKNAGPINLALASSTGCARELFFVIFTTRCHCISRGIVMSVTERGHFGNFTCYCLFLIPSCRVSSKKVLHSFFGL